MIRSHQSHLRVGWALVVLSFSGSTGCKDERPKAVANPVSVGPAAECPPELDPRLTFATPYRNVRPDVEYVGDPSCANCHVSHSKN